MRTINERSDATAMDEAVQNKTVSPRELVQATIREAERTNPKINAIVSQRYEKALKEAETRDFLKDLQLVSFKSLELAYIMTQLFQLKNVSYQLTFWIKKLVSINRSTLMKLTTL